MIASFFCPIPFFMVSFNILLPIFELPPYTQGHSHEYSEVCLPTYAPILSQAKAHKQMYT